MAHFSPFAIRFSPEEIGGRPQLISSSVGRKNEVSGEERHWLMRLRVAIPDLDLLKASPALRTALIRRSPRDEES